MVAKYNNQVVRYGDKAVNLGNILLSSGGTVTYDGDYKIHTFDSSGTFIITQPIDASILVVGAGGSGGSSRYDGVGGYITGCGGGGGEVLFQNISIASGVHNVLIGKGYAGTSANGGNSSFLNLDASGGKGGGQGVGGVGGGSGNGLYIGGNSWSDNRGGAGAGDSGNGPSSTSSTTASWGIGTYINFRDNSVGYGGGGAGGGSAASGAWTTTHPTGGGGGGPASATSPPRPNSGGGSGGSFSASSISFQLPHSAADGIVIIRYKYK